MLCHTKHSYHKWNEPLSLNTDSLQQSDSACRSETSGWIWGSFYFSPLKLNRRKRNEDEGQTDGETAELSVNGSEPVGLRQTSSGLQISPSTAAAWVKDRTFLTCSWNKRLKWRILKSSPAFITRNTHESIHSGFYLDVLTTKLKLKTCSPDTEGSHQVSVVGRDAEGAGAGCRSGNLTALFLHVDPEDYKNHLSITCVLCESKQCVDQS